MFNKIYKISLLDHLIALLAIMFIFGPPIVGLPTAANLGIISAISLLIILYIHLNLSTAKIPKMLFTGGVLNASIILALLVYSFILSGNTISEFETRAFRLLFFAIVAFLIAILIAQRKNAAILTFHYFLIFLIFNSTIVILQIIFPITTELIDTIVYDSTNLKQGIYERYKGVVSFGGAGLSTFNCLYFLILPYLWKDLNKQQKNFYLFSIPIIFFSVFFIGRSGIIALFIIIISFAVFNRKYILFLYLLLISLFLVLTAHLVHSKVIDIPSINNTLEKVFEPLINPLFTEKKETPGTIKSFSKMIYLPEDTKTLLIGNGTFAEHTPPSSGNYKTSDSGFIRQIYAIGLIMTTLMWFSLFSLKNILFKRQRFYFFTFVLIMFVLHIKEPFILRPQSFKFFSLLFLILIIDGLKNSNNKFSNEKT